MSDWSSWVAAWCMVLGGCLVFVLCVLPLLAVCVAAWIGHALRCADRHRQV